MKFSFSEIVSECVTLAARLFSQYQQGNPEAKSPGFFYVWLQDNLRFADVDELLSATGVSREVYDRFYGLIESPAGIDFVTMNWYRITLADRVVNGVPIRSIITSTFLIYADGTLFSYTSLMLKNQLNELVNDAVIAHHGVMYGEHLAEVVRDKGIDKIHDEFGMMTFGIAPLLVLCRIVKESLNSLSDNELVAVNFLMETIQKVIYPVITDEQKRAIEQANKVELKDGDRVAWPQFPPIGMNIKSTTFIEYAQSMNFCLKRMMERKVHSTSSAIDPRLLTSEGVIDETRRNAHNKKEDGK